MIARTGGWLPAAIAIVVWGVTFASTRALLEDFSSLEILLLRFSLAWMALWGFSVCPRRGRAPHRARFAARCARICGNAGGECTARPESAPYQHGNAWCGEWIFAAMGFTGIVAYQFLENCAIYYTNASNVAILVSFGPIVTALMAKAFARGGQFSARLVIGSLVAVCGVALIS